MSWALIDINNIVVNAIDYDGVSVYTPPAGLKLINCPVQPQVGDTVDASGNITTLGQVSIQMGLALK